MPRRILRSRAYQFAHDPESLVMITRSGSRGESSHVTRCGLTGLAFAIARFSSVFHQLETFFSISVRHDRSRFCSSIGNSSLKVSALSPTKLTSIG
ncbi:hypothetical protein GALL_533780 [mine drainage metagenome]|uniref:Uncharacterized protein n=1 Tax=mine drainage metagenome TaxID=410659 RepID=A0A1J5PIG4_9ZZZZ